MRRRRKCRQLKRVRHSQRLAEGGVSITMVVSAKMEPTQSFPAAAEMKMPEAAARLSISFTECENELPKLMFAIALPVRPLDLTSSNIHWMPETKLSNAPQHLALRTLTEIRLASLATP